MSQEGPERKRTELIDRFAPPKRQLERKQAYLAGKPIRMHWWVCLLYMIPWALVFGAGFGPVVYESIRTGLPTGILISPWPVVLLGGYFCWFVVEKVRRIPQIVVLEKDGLYFRASLLREDTIRYADITSYTLHPGRPGGMSVRTFDGKRHFFHRDLVGWIYLYEEIKSKVGEDKQEEPIRWRQKR